jgi:LysR family D-serine deaminase transcriptional activator
MYTKENIFFKGRINSFQLSKLHTFEVAARHCSFSLAAKELSLTPSAISHRINNLEEELSVKLFLREHRKLTLTDEGKRIFQALTRTLDDLNQEIIEVRNKEISGPLTVYSRPSFAQYWLIPRIKYFIERYPSIDLRILTGNERVNFQGYGIDLAIYYDDQIPKKLYYKELLSEFIIPVCTPAYSNKHNLPSSKNNILNATLLHDNQAWDYTSGKDEWEKWAEHNNIKNLSSVSSISFDRSDLAITAALNNTGIAMGRLNLVNDLILSGDLITPYPDTQLQCNQKYYAVTKNSHLTHKVRIFIEWLEAEINQNPS